MIRTLVTTLTTTTCIVAFATPAAAQSRAFHIPAGSLKSALDAYARQSGRQVIYRADEVRSARSAGVNGDVSGDAALDAVLASTGFNVKTDSSGALAIVKSGNGQVNADKGSPGAGDLAADREAKSSLAENDIVVTGAKLGGKAILETPASITSIETQSLAETDQSSLLEYYSKIPGLTLSYDGQGRLYYSIRGISPGRASTPTVGTTMDEIPLGASLTAQGTVTDLDPGDLSSIEVLRGPQGTLYGANAMGGLINFRTADPSLSGMSGHLTGGANTVQGSGEVGYNLGAALNVPISDSVAIRASGHFRRNAGYIDDPTNGRRDVNGLFDRGGLVKLLVEPSNKASLLLTAYYQAKKYEGFPFVDIGPGLADLQQARYSVNEHGTDVVQLYSAKGTVELGGIKFTSITAYQKTDFKENIQLDALAPFIPGAAHAVSIEDFAFNKFSEEARAEVPVTEKGKLLLGYFHQYENYYPYQQINGLDNNGAYVGNYATFTQGQNIYREDAIFANFSYDVSSRFNIQFGGRESWIFTGGKTPLHIEGGAFSTPIDETNPATNLQQFTYSVNPSFKITPDIMLYARIATGYRPGGANPAINGGPLNFSSDSLTDYELGLKGKVRSLNLTFDASVFYIDWRKIQVLVTIPTGGFDTNGGSARSDGAELALGWQPTPTFSIDGWFDYTDSEITEAFPAGSRIAGLPGYPIPFSAKYSANLSLRKTFRIPLGMDFFGSASTSYIGQRTGIFQAPGVPRAVYPSYVKADAEIGINAGKLTASLYVNNILDKRGVVEQNALVASEVVYIQPRTVGISITRNF